MKSNYLFSFLLCAVFSQFAHAAVLSNYKTEETNGEIERLTEQISNNPNDINLFHSRSIAYARARMYDLAISDIDVCIEHSPADSVDALQNFYAIKASYCYKEGNRKETILWFQKSIQVNPYNIDAYHNFSAYYEKIGNFKAAIELFQTALEYNEKSVDAYTEISRLYYYQEKFADGLKYAQKALYIDKNSYEANLMSCLCNYHLHNYRNAIDNLVAAGCLYDGYEFFVFLSANDKKYAVKKLAKSIKSDLNANTKLSKILAMGYLCKREGKNQEALEYAMTAVDMLEGKYNYYAECLKVEAYMDLYQNDKAIVCVDTIRNHTNSPYVDLLSARVNFNDGNYTIAEFYLNKLLNSRVYDYWAYYLLGLCYEYKKDFDSALDCYNKGIERNSDFSYLYLMRGRLYMNKKNNISGANVDFNKIIDLEKDDEVKSCSQYAYLFLGKKSEAEKITISNLAQHPDNALYFYDAACLYARMGDRNKAISYLQKSFEMGYNCFRQVLVDEDMDNIRDTEEYESLRKQYNF